VNQNWYDESLNERWQNIIAVRGEVTKALEEARVAKKIGHSLDASVSIYGDDTLYERLSPYLNDLRSIFIVSSVNMVEIDRVEVDLESESMPGLKVMVTPSSDPKCERCWKRSPEVGKQKIS
jgi:isoleucyl-tRNA synthetase